MQPSRCALCPVASPDLICPGEHAPRICRQIDPAQPEYDARYRDYWQTYLSMTRRKGISEQYAKLEMRRPLSSTAGASPPRPRAEVVSGASSFSRSATELTP